MIYAFLCDFNYLNENSVVYKYLFNNSLSRFHNYIAMINGEI